MEETIKIYSEEEIIKKWEEKLPSLKKPESFNLYIENPFCMSNCLYCKHSGVIFSKDPQGFKDYYEKNNCFELLFGYIVFGLLFLTKTRSVFCRIVNS